MRSLLGAISTVGAAARVRGGSVRLPLLAGIATSTLIAITGATALPSHDSAKPVAPPIDLTIEPITYLGAEADTSAASQSIDADPHAERFTGLVGNDLTQSLKAAGVPERQGREYVAVLGRAIQLAGGLSVEDRFDLVIERTEAGEFGRLLYAGLDRIARADVELLKWTDGKSTIWVNADGVGGETSSAMRLPVSGRVTSGFGNRFHPILGYARFHKGVDLGASAGTPIVAAADGRVVAAGWHGGYGRQVAIAHADGIQTSYGHMSQIAAYPGEIVRRGQVIGYVGSTGLSTGPHLHFEVTKNGHPVNPMSVKLGGVPAQLQGEKLHVFQSELRQLLLLQAS